MGRKAITLIEQIELLEERGMIITDKAKAEEVLLDIGYYRMGFYWFPFEIGYPNKNNRSHRFVEGTNFDDAVKLYYFDFNLRNILLKYLSRIEINFRTYLTYEVSNYYRDSPFWFVDPMVVSEKQIATFDTNVYTTNFRRNPAIARHHKIHREDTYAPAWKTIEFMTLGNVISLYGSLIEDELKQKIANHFGINSIAVFENYIKQILNVRNVCAHGNILYDFAPINSICKGPAMMKNVGRSQNLSGVIKIILYMIRQVSIHRYDDLRNELLQLIKKYSVSSVVQRIIEDSSGLSMCDYE